MIFVSNLMFIILLALFLSGCGGEKRHSETKILMGTLVKIDICPEYDEKVVEDAYKSAWKRLGQISQNMSVFNKSSDVSKINQSYPQGVVVTKDSFEVVSRAVYYSEITSGAFDITIKPLIDLWKNAEREKVLPDDSEIASIKEVIGYKYINLLEQNRIKLLNQSVSIDLGGIAKGYAVDEAANIIKENSIQNFFIDAGGDLYASGINCKGKKWKIGIKDPESRNEIIEVIEVSDAAVTTSGNYEQFYEIDGEQWSHIIDPRTGYPQKDIVSATIIAPSAMEADVLSTAVTVLGMKEGIGLIEEMDDGYAGFVIQSSEQGSEISETRTFKKYSSKKK